MAGTAARSRRTPSRATKLDHVGMGMYDVAVVRKTLLSPHLVRITLAGDQLRDFCDDGPDQRFKLLLPRDGQEAPVLPDPDNWYDAWRAMDENVRPIMRTYTVRSARPEQAELDIDVVLHDPAGPACRWAATAKPGDRVGVYAAWAEYEVPAGARQLIIGDHTALAAVAAIGERLVLDARAEILIEVPGGDDILDLELPAGVGVCWVFTRPGEPGAALRQAVTELPDGREWDYAWVCADQSTVAELRRHLVQHRGLTPGQIMFMGYWRTDGPIDE